MNIIVNKYSFTPPTFFYINISSKIDPLKGVLRLKCVCKKPRWQSRGRSSDFTWDYNLIASRGRAISKRRLYSLGLRRRGINFPQFQRGLWTAMDEGLLPAISLSKRVLVPLALPCGSSKCLFQKLVQHLSYIKVSYFH